MSTLIVYPTARAVREASARLKESEGLTPRLMRVDEFLGRLMRVPGRAMVQGDQRIFLLREAADFDGFSRIQKDRNLLKFFFRSDDFFRFFEELAWEKIPLERLEEADAYAEYVDHLKILSQLRERYEKILEREGLYDRMFLPQLYKLNRSFLSAYEKIEFYLEGYLSRFEMELLEHVAESRELTVHWRTTPFNEKMRARFAEIGIDIPAMGAGSFSWSEHLLKEWKSRPLALKTKVLSVQERYEQVALALAEIEGMVRRGIPPERIALVLPKEEFKTAFALYDRMDNLNFSMGFDVKSRLSYRVPEGILRWWRSAKPEDRQWLIRLGAPQALDLSPTVQCGVNEFFEHLAQKEVPGFVLLEEGAKSREYRALQEARFRFARLHIRRRLPLRDWLFLWLRELEEIRLDDVRGGKVTVMGVLETRGVRFEGVVLVDFNDGIVPAQSGKDRFLDSRVRRFAGLPDRRDREALQKHYYARLLEEAKESVILYSRGEHRLPSRVLYELGLGEGRSVAAPKELLYRESISRRPQSDPVVEQFEPTQMLWSASRLKTWLECPRKFYYRYLRGWEEKSSNEINEGVVLHQILEALYRRKSSFEDEEQLQRELESIATGLLEKEGVYGEYLRRFWLRILREFVRNEIEHFRKGWQVYATEVRVEKQIEGLRFSGRVDRLDRREEEWMAVDYKSGSILEANRKVNLEKLTDFQMSLYRILLSDKSENVRVAFVPILEGGGYVELSEMEEKEQRLREHLRELRETRSFIAQRTLELSRCRYCPYQLLCGRGEYL